jgi:hypothetical protein
MMKKNTLLLTISLFTLLLVGADKCPPGKLIRLTMVNKATLPIEISLTGSIENNDYYLRVGPASEKAATTKDFTIIPDKYSVTVYYIELWDPVYGKHCSNKSQSIQAKHNLRVSVPPCKYAPPNKGEPAMVKIGGSKKCRAKRGR